MSASDGYFFTSCKKPLYFQIGTFQPSKALKLGTHGGVFFLFLHQKGAIIQRRRLFQVFLTGGCALNLFVLLYQTIKQVKYMNITIEKHIKNGAFVTIQLLTIIRL